MSLPFFFLAVITLFKLEYVLLWKLSILSTEYGHWLALGSAFLIAWYLYRRPFTIYSGISSVLLLISLVIFARPTVQAYMSESMWKAQLQHGLGIESQNVLLSFRQLWWGKKPVTLPFERIKYADVPSEDMGLDFYRAQSASPAPWLLIVHGGGWDSGDTSQLADINSYLARRGIAVASVSYRLAPKWRWPTQKDDVLSAVAYIKLHAKELNIDPNRWAILGRSAGGQIAEAVAYGAGDSSLKGLIAYYSPADMHFAYKYTEDKDIINSRDLLKNFLGGTPQESKKTYDDASPILYAGKKSPPTLLVHGANDPLTWNLQSRRLFEQLKKSGARAAYIELPWATHAFDFNLNGPAGQVATNAVVAFLNTIFSNPVK